MKFVVIAPMSSGTRLLKRLLQEGGYKTITDTSHGTQDLDPGWTPIRIMRNPIATEKSRASRWSGRPEEILYLDSITEIESRYKDTYVVHYEDLVEDANVEIEKIARHFNLEPWVIDQSSITDENKKWLIDDV